MRLKNNMGFFENFTADKTYLQVFEQPLDFTLKGGVSVSAQGLVTIDQLKDDEMYIEQQGTLGVQRHLVKVQPGDQFTDPQGRTWYVDNLYEQKGSRDYWKIHADNEGAYPT